MCEYLSSLATPENHPRVLCLNLSDLTSAEGLMLPSTVEGGLDLSGLTSAEGLVLPTTVSGSTRLSDSVRQQLRARVAKLELLEDSK